jgi:nucleoside-diphosphate-sugar epimerase
VRGDLTSPDCPLDKFLVGCDVVFHCAGEIHDVENMHLLHIDGSQRLLQAVLKTSTQTRQKIHWVQLSSVGAYGPPCNLTTSDRMVNEDTPLRPVGEYEITKTRADELVMLASHGSSKLTYSIVRPSNVFGASMTNNSLRELIKMVKSGLFFYVGKPGAIATYVHVEDVVSALIKSSFEPMAKGRIYNLSNDCLLDELIKHIASLLGVRPPWMRIPEMPIRAMVEFFDGWMNIPLTQSRIDALVKRTRYPTDRIVSELAFSFSKPMPESISDLVREFF